MKNILNKTVFTIDEKNAWLVSGIVELLLGIAYVFYLVVTEDTFKINEETLVGILSLIAGIITLSTWIISKRRKH